MVFCFSEIASRVNQIFSIVNQSQIVAFLFSSQSRIQSLLGIIVRFLVLAVVKFPSLVLHFHSFGYVVKFTAGCFHIGSGHLHLSGKYGVQYGTPGMLNGNLRPCLLLSYIIIYTSKYPPMFIFLIRQPLKKLSANLVIALSTGFLIIFFAIDFHLNSDFNRF